MAESVSSIVPPTAHIAADQADPQVSIRAADSAFVKAGVFSQACAVVDPFSKTEIVLGVAADGTA